MFAKRKTKSSRGRKQAAAEPCASKSTADEDGEPAQSVLLEVARLRLLEFDCEVQDRLDDMHACLQEASSAVRQKVMLQVQKLPLAVRQLPVDRFVSEFGADIALAIAALSREKSLALAPLGSVKSPPDDSSVHVTAAAEQFVANLDIDSLLSQCDPDLFGGKS